MLKRSTFFKIESDTNAKKDLSLEGISLSSAFTTDNGLKSRGSVLVSVHMHTIAFAHIHTYMQITTHIHAHPITYKHAHSLAGRHLIPLIILLLDTHTCSDMRTHA